jgi:hypothetical protein
MSSCGELGDAPYIEAVIYARKTADEMAAAARLREIERAKIARRLGIRVPGQHRWWLGWRQEWKELKVYTLLAIAILGITKLIGLAYIVMAWLQAG